MTKIIQRHDTAANWTSVNPVLAAGEMGVETDTNKFKFGDGVTAWSDLAYAAGEGGSGSGTTLTSTDGTTTYSELTLGDTLSVTDTSTKELNKLTQTGGTLNSELEFTGASGASLKMTEKYALATADSWEFQIKYKHNGGGNNPCVFGYASGSDYKTPAFILEGGSFKFFLSSNGGSWNINSSGSGLAPQAGTIYYFKVGFTGSQYYVKYNTTGWSDEFTTQWTLNSTAKVYCSDYFMLMNLSLNSGYYNTGTMYLQDTALIVNGSEVWRGANIIPGPLSLNANLDELGNEVNTLAGSVSTLESSVSTVESSVNTLESSVAELSTAAGNKQDVLKPVDTLYIEERILGVLTQDWYKDGVKIDTPAAITSDTINGVTYYPYGTQVLEKEKNIHIAFDIEVTYDVSPSSNILRFFFSKDRGYVQVVYDRGYGCDFKVYIAGTTVSYREVVSTGGIGGTNRLHFVFDWNNSSKAWSCVVTGVATGITYYNQTGTANYDFTTGLTEPPTITYHNYKGSYTSVISIYTDTIELSSSNDKTLVIGNNYEPSPATTSSLGVVQPDGTSITISDTGVISGQDVKTFQGYSDTGTLVLKSINGVLQWVAE